MSIPVDPNLLQQTYHQMLSESQGQVAMFKAALLGLQSDNAQLNKEVKELRAENEELRQQTGRKDGVPSAKPSH